MAVPLFKVEVAFANGPNDAAPTYTDISQYVRRDPPLTYSRGNTDETQQLQAGQMSFAVDNTDGRFTVGSSASTSAWGTSLKIRRPVRLSIWDGSAYQVAWTGTVDDWGAGWLGGVKGLSRVTCSDRVASAGRIQLPDLIGGEIAAAAPRAFFPFDDPAGSVRFDPYGFTPTIGTWTGSDNFVIYDYGNSGTKAITFGVAGPGVESRTAMSMTASSASVGYYAAGAGGPANLSAATLSIFAQTSTVRLQGIISTGTIGSPALTIGTTATGFAYAFATSTTSVTVTGPYIADGGWHHLAATVSGGTLALYVDGVSAGTGAFTNASPALNGLVVGADETGNNLFNGIVACAATWSSALSATTVGYIASAGSTSVETTGERWARLCRIAGLSSTWYAADATTGTLALSGTSGTSLASALQDVAKAEQGYAYATSSGVLTLKARSTRFSRTSSLTVAPQSAGKDLEFVANDAYLVNTAQVANDSKAELASDSTSQTDYGIYRVNESPGFPAGSAQALNLAQWLVYRYKTPTARARGLSINGTTKASSITATQLLALDVNSRITLSPLTGPAPASSVQVFIDGLSGSIGAEWEVTYNTSPTTGLDGLVLDTSTLDNAASILLY